jgi:hypothetical protein
MMKVKAIQRKRWPLTYKGLRSLLGLANYHHHHLIQKKFKVATTLPDLLEKNGYPMSEMSFVTKPLWSLRTSSLRRPCSSLQNLANLLRCIRG